jgi:putative N6-adenine-specific DNA methylase
MNQYFATVARGLEPLLAQELDSLGAEAIEPGFCGVGFRGDRRLLYSVNLWARLPFRVLKQLDCFPCQDADDLYRGIEQLDWSEYLTPDHTLAVQSSGKTPQLNHSHFTALQVKNAIVDQQRQQFGDRSDVDPDLADVQIHVHLGKGQCTVSLNSSGDSLHRRGYRPAVGVAPLKESLASALVHLSGWQPGEAFYDPLCGSGTLPLEACLQALQVAPGSFRSWFGFEGWRDYDADLWHQLQDQAEAQRRATSPGTIWGSDCDEAVIDQAMVNAGHCGVQENIWFSVMELQEVEPPSSSGVLICNPPYGERLGRDSDLGRFYKLLGDVLKQRFKGWRAYVLSGNKELAMSIGLKSARRFPVYNGSLPCQLMEYELY